MKRAFSAGKDHRRHFKGQKTTHGNRKYEMNSAQSQLVRQIDVIHAKLETVAKVADNAALQTILDSAEVLRQMAQRIDSIPLLNPVQTVQSSTGGGGPMRMQQQAPLLPDHKKFTPSQAPPQEFYRSPMTADLSYQPASQAYEQQPYYNPAYMEGFDPNHTFDMGYAQLGRPPVPPKRLGQTGGFAKTNGQPRYRGVVKSWFIHNSNGFIICRDPVCQGQDVYVMSRHLRSPLVRLRPGDKVEFYVTIMKGRPQARDLCLLNQKPAVRVRGRCTKWNEERKYGFIKSSGYKDSNIFCLATEILNRPQRRLYEGEDVECSVVMDQKGRPQAHDVTPMGPAPSHSHQSQAESSKD
ncbi:hypothetical protein AAMO2058_001109000 [Amorphochlora amoebiformis]